MTTTSSGRVSTLTTPDESPAAYLSSSLSSLSSQRAQSSWIARTYKHAAQLYLTRRLSEALAAIEPVITPDPDLIQQQYYSSSSISQHDSNDERDGNNYEAKEESQIVPAPVAAASRNTRIKVWSFFLTLLNAIIELGPEEGKSVVGHGKWKDLASKARDGSIWDEVVRVGYGGSEAEVDGEVAVNLATLLLTHMATQTLNQRRLETYLASTQIPTLDVVSHMEAMQNGTKHRSSHTNGTSTPRDLNTRLKLLELYTLHVLPQNGEWEYSKDFIKMSEVLDDERREAFLLALQSLQEEKRHDAIRAEELQKRQQEEMENQKKEEERRRKMEAEAEQQRLKEVRTNDDNGKHSIVPGHDPSSQRGNPKANDTHTNKSFENGKTPKRKLNGQASTNSQHSRTQKKALDTSPGMLRRATILMTALQTSLLQFQHSLVRNPMLLLRFLLFIAAFLLTFGRRDVRERLKRLLGDAWNKVRRTVGMGVKVSYI